MTEGQGALAQWAELRQVGFAALDHAAAVRAATDCRRQSPALVAAR